MLSHFSSTVAGFGAGGEEWGIFPLKFSLDSRLHLQTRGKYGALYVFSHKELFCMASNTNLNFM